MKKTGKIKFFNSTKGYGFIIDNESKTDIFFHVSKVMSSTEPKQGNDVEYLASEDPKRKQPIAIDIYIV